MEAAERRGRGSGLPDRGRLPERRVRGRTPPDAHRQDDGAGKPLSFTLPARQAESTDQCRRHQAWQLPGNQNPTPEEILHFHQFTESENKEFGLQINRNDVLKTISITQCKVTSNTIKMEYLELFE